MLPPACPRPSPPVPVAPAAPVAAPPGDRVERFLCELITALVPEDAPAGRGRPRILPALALWAGLVVGVLRGFDSQRALWRLLRGQGLGCFPRFEVSDEAVYRRLAGAGTAPLERLFADVTALLLARPVPTAAAALAPFAAEVVALDETTLDPVARSLPTLRPVPPGDARLLPGKLAGVFDLRRQLWRHLEHLPAPHQNSKVAARGLLAGIAKGSLILADLGYFGFAWFDDLTDAGYWWVSRLRAKTSYTLLHVHYQRGDTLDALVWLGAYRADRAKHAVRLVQFRQHGTLYRYLTNVTDPTVLPLPEVARLYARRWDIELAVKLVKRELGLHLLWSAKTDVVLQQVWAVLLIAQLWQALRGELAAKAGVDPFEVSLPLLIRYFPQYAARGGDPVAAFLGAARALGFIRPSRRTRIEAPRIDPADLDRPPPDLVRERTPRYAHRNCHKRPAMT